MLIDCLKCIFIIALIMIYSIRLLSVIIPIILIPALTFSQTTATINKNSTIITGSVIEEISHMPLPYINIGINGKPIGTVSDSTGNYSLTIFIENLKDSLQLSSVGYAVKRILIADLIRQNNVPIELKRKPMTLAEVVVNGTNTRTQIIGRQDSELLVQVSIHNQRLVIIKENNQLFCRVERVINGYYRLYDRRIS